MPQPLLHDLGILPEFQQQKLGRRIVIPREKFLALFADAVTDTGES